MHIRTFGCQMNVHDSSRIGEIMEQHGYTLVHAPDDADVVILNTCSVREKAWHKAVSETGRMVVLKRKRPDLIIVATGCVAQQEGEKWLDRGSGPDLVVGPDHYAQLPALVEGVLKGKGKSAAVGFDKGLATDFLVSNAESKKHPVSAYVTVMKGCSEKCGYCIVPSVRGPARSRPSEDIINESRSLVSRGASEIMLLGQQVNAYKKNGVGFAALLKQLDQVPGLERLRFTSPHPRYMKPDLIESFGTLETLCESIHLPVQSGSDRILKRMGRRYSSDFYRDVAAQLVKACPDIMISTDLIVGFPGESEADFEKTIQLIEDVHFSGVFSFKYSPRPGTGAAELPDDVPEDVKARRLATVHEIVARIENEIRTSLVGSRQEVLIEGQGRIEGQVTGRARNSQIINFFPPANATIIENEGRLVDVEVIRALPHCLEGRVLTRGITDERYSDDCRKSSF